MTAETPDTTAAPPVAPPDQLVTTAVQRTGLDDFGADTWQEGLDRFVADLNEHGRLHELGVAIAEGEIVDYLSNRLGIVEWRKTHPAVAEGRIDRPLVIVGQPRTGTTILYDLLAQDPAHRAPMAWEVDRPVPPPRTETYDTDPRIDEVQATIDMADSLIPGFTAFHPMGARLAQECVRITASDFRSMIFPTQYHVPDYDRWLLYEADMAPAYRWHRMFLQHLQSEHPGDRWLLKSPAHLWHLGDLLAEYPDAVVVQTHRDPVKVVASVSALMAHLRQMTSDDTSIAEAAAEYAEDNFEGLDRSMAARRDGTLPAAQVVDVQFTDFVADPLATIGALYDQLGLELGAETEARMRAFLDAHPGDGGGGGSRYTFADTGLDLDELRERSRSYQEHFGVASEPVT
ncbi:MAG: sulfotransferase family protein [Acidimicrobiales bacterium]